jgi:hypothetical protein
MNNTGRPRPQLDPLNPRVVAAITAVVVALILVAGPTLGLPVLTVQASVFAAGALLGLRYQPYDLLVRRLFRTRLKPSMPLVDERPSRFTHGLGLVALTVAAVGSLTGLPVIFYTATGLVLATALVKAVFGYCWGCGLYRLGQRVLMAGLRPETGPQR